METVVILPKQRIALFAVFLLIGAVGCQRAAPPEFVASEADKSLSKELQTAVHSELVKWTGDYTKPKFLAQPDETHHDLARGQAVYQLRCVQCHGVTGDGNGESAKFMYPRPRDYRKGIFKFTSTPYGYRPLREDLLRTIRQGIRGTSMPGFNLLSDQDLQAVVDYVITLTRRGELEAQIVETAQSDEAVNPEEVKDDMVTLIWKRWADAEASEVFPATPQPKLTAENVERGRAAFLSKGCSKCHGEDGRGQTVDNRGADIWGHQTRAADLTSGMLHGGNRPIDIYRRIHNGINGTPMPGFANIFKDNPETIWDLVAYVFSMTNKRREGLVPPPGAIKPYVPPKDHPAAEPGNKP